MPEMLSPGAALVGAGLGKTVALVTDGRFSGASHGTDIKYLHNLIINHKIIMIMLQHSPCLFAYRYYGWSCYP